TGDQEGSSMMADQNHPGQFGNRNDTEKQAQKGGQPSSGSFGEANPADPSQARRKGGQSASGPRSAATALPTNGKGTARRPSPSPCPRSPWLATLAAGADQPGIRTTRSISTRMFASSEPTVVRAGNGSVKNSRYASLN